MSPAPWAAAAAALTVLLWWVPAKPPWTPGARGEGGLAGWGAGHRRGAGAGRGTAGQAASDHTGGVSIVSHEELQQEMKQQQSQVDDLEESKEEFSAAIKEAECVKEACRGVSLKEITALQGQCIAPIRSKIV